MQYIDTPTILHCHSEHSLKDSPMKINDLVARAKAMGVQNLTLTDHGTCTGWYEFMNTCRKAGINPIPGVEAYVKTPYANHAHLLLIAKNYTGLQEISHAVSDANKHLENIGAVQSPIMDFSILRSCFSGGNVFASSACINGVIATAFLSNKIVEKRIEALKRKKAKYDDEHYDEKVAEEAQLDERIRTLTEKKKVLAKCADKKYTQREKNIENRKKNGYECEDLERQLNEEKQESERAAEEIAEIKKTLANLRSKRTSLHKTVLSLQNAHKRIESLSEEIRALQKQLIPEQALYSRTEEMLTEFVDIFGRDFLVELQYHGLDAEAEVMPVLASIAQKHNVPMVVANDAHIALREQATARQFVKALRFLKWDAISEADKELYLKSDQDLYDMLTQILPPKIVENAIFNTRLVGGACKVEIPPDTHYPKFTDETNQDKSAEDMLRQMVAERIPHRFSEAEFNDEYKERMSYELDVICNLGYADYFLIVQDYINYAKNLALHNNELGVGYGVGPGRGSGCGSLVCYILGITDIDPLKYSLIFERFLNKERVSMPDIDADFSDEVREATIEHVKQKYGEESVACIRTVIRQGPKAAIRNSARLKGFELYGSSPNSLADVTKTYESEETGDETVLKAEWNTKMKSIRGLGDTIAKAIPDKVGTQFSDCMPALEEKFGKDPVSMDIIHRAAETEDLITGLSIHAAGVVIGDGQPLKYTVPLMYNSSKQQWAIQCDMIEAEHDLKLLKMDFLGLNNLNFISDCIRDVKAKRGITVPIDNLPQEDLVYSEIFSKGNTNCVFQFESSGMKQMLRDFRPTCFEDIILLVAAYRPGPMQYLPSVIARKHNREKTVYSTEMLRPILQETYGATIYQEQVMQIFQKLAGYSFGYADNVRRAMSKKHEDELARERSSFIYGDPERNIPGCVANGIKAETADKLFDEMMDFASYAFNKAHATAYAFISYQTAYLKFHYPAEYMCAVMRHSKVNDIPALLSECKRMGLKLSTPNVNESELDFICHDDEIIYGLHAIKGFDDNSAQKIIDERNTNGPYVTFREFVGRTGLGSGALEKLIYSGALDTLDSASRDSKAAVIPDLLEIFKIIDKKSEVVKEIQEKIPETLGEIATYKELLQKDNLKEYAIQKAKEEEAFFNQEYYDVVKQQLQKQLKLSERAYNLLLKRDVTAKEALALAEENLDMIEYSKSEGDVDQNLMAERELLGSYISQHPMDSYAYLYQGNKNKYISDISAGRASYAGVISELRVVKRRSDHAEMAFFTLEDATGVLPVCAFADTYEKFSGVIQEGNVVRIYGLVKNDGSDENPDIKLVASDITKCRRYYDPILIVLDDEQVESTYKMILQSMRNSGDCPVYICYRRRSGHRDCQIIPTDDFVSGEILDLKPAGMQIVQLKFSTITKDVNAVYRIMR